MSGALMNVCRTRSIWSQEFCLVPPWQMFIWRKGGARSKELLLFIVNRNPTVLFLNPNKDHSLRSDTRHRSDKLAAGRKLKCAAVTWAEPSFYPEGSSIEECFLDFIYEERENPLEPGCMLKCQNKHRKQGPRDHASPSTGLMVMVSHGPSTGSSSG